MTGFRQANLQSKNILIISVSCNFCTQPSRPHQAAQALLRLRRQRLGLRCDVFRRKVALQRNDPHPGLVEVDGLEVDHLDLLAPVSADVSLQVGPVVRDGPLGSVRIDQLRLATRSEKSLRIRGLVGGVAPDGTIEDVERVEHVEAEVDRVGRRRARRSPVREKRGADETRWRRHVAGQSDGAAALPVVHRREFAQRALGHIDRRYVDVVADIDRLPIVRRRVGQGAERRIMDLQFSADVFGNDHLARVVTDPVVDRQDFFERHELLLRDVDVVLQSGHGFIHGRAIGQEITQHFPAADRLVRRRGLGIKILRKAREIEHAEGQALFILTVSQQRRGDIRVQSDKTVFRRPLFARFAAGCRAGEIRAARDNEHLRVERIAELHGAEINLRPVFRGDLESRAGQGGRGDVEGNHRRNGGQRFRNARNLLFHLGRRIHCGAGLGRGKGGCGGKGEIFC